MKGSAEVDLKVQDSCSNIQTIYSFYCKLNPHKMKHRNFDDVSNKNIMMDLH